jgi:hypothetical protein
MPSSEEPEEQTETKRVRWLGVAGIATSVIGGGIVRRVSVSDRFEHTALHHWYVQLAIVLILVAVAAGADRLWQSWACRSSGHAGTP